MSKIILRQTARLRELLARPGCLVAPGVADAFGARLVKMEGFDAVYMTGFGTSLTRLGTDYVDLFLIHWPLPTRYDGDFVSTWKTLEEFKADGRARSIGVSNFEIHQDRKSVV